MPKVSVYLPDELYRRVRERNISVSAVAQRALERELRSSAVDDWLDGERSRTARAVRQVDVARLLDEVRGEFGR